MPTISHAVIKQSNLVTSAPTSLDTKMRREFHCMLFVLISLQIFREVSILFSDVVGFTTICSKINPMAVVSLLNAMYTKFDKLSEELSVYKVSVLKNGRSIKLDHHLNFISTICLRLSCHLVGNEGFLFVLFFSA